MNADPLSSSTCATASCVPNASQQTHAGRPPDDLIDTPQSLRMRCALPTPPLARCATRCLAPVSDSHFCWAFYDPMQRTTRLFVTPQVISFIFRVCQRKYAPSTYHVQIMCHWAFFCMQKHDTWMHHSFKAVSRISANTRAIHSIHRCGWP